MPSLFDAYIAVDWSARSKPSPERPSRDAIWVGEGVAPGIDDPTVQGETYWRTRHACEMYLLGRLLHHRAKRRRVFVGFDFGYGYPCGFAEALGLGGEAPPWRLVWDKLTALVEDGEDNHNNRFDVAAGLNALCGGPTPGPFWGCPTGQECETLEMTMPVGRFPYQVREGLVLENFRRTDQGAKGVQPIWKLCGPGSVGGQTLMGIPTVCRLREDKRLSGFSRAWPFETGFTATPTPAKGPFVLHVEIWPGVVRDLVDRNDPIRDRAQVRAMVRWLRNLDEGGELGRYFDTPSGLTPEEIEVCVGEEGWIIGVR